MAKVDGPLFSLEARGKIGDAIVFFPWKGRHAVRRWLKPTNPQDIDQQLIRQKVAAFGHCLAAIITPGADLANGAAAVEEWKEHTPAAQIWNAYFVKVGMEDLACDTRWIAAMTAVFASAASQSFSELALELGIPTIESTADKYASDVPPWEQLAAAAYAAYKVGYSDADLTIISKPEAWLLADITLFASAFTVARP